METEIAFVAAMAADPDNDLPRLVFADWLEENGDEARAEFIRLQCEPNPDTATQARTETLLNTHRAAWERPLAPLHGPTSYGVIHRRGFPYYLQTHIARIIENQELLRFAPEWDLSPRRDGWDYEPQPDLMRQFIAGPFVDRVRGLNLAWAGWLPEELDILLSPPLAGRLRELRFGDSNGEAEFAAMDRNPDLRLEALGFGGDSYGIGDHGCQLIADDSRFAGLRTLELPNNGLSEEGATALAESEHLTQLRELILAGGSNSSNEIGAVGTGAIAESGNFRHLETLDLVYNGIEDDGFAALVCSPNMPELRMLNVPGCGVTNAGLIALAESDAVPKLSWLNVCGTDDGGITVVGLRALLESPRMERFTGLKFSGARFRDAGAELLADCPACRNLTELQIGGCGLTVAGFERLLESPYLRGVTNFHLRYTGLSEKQLARLREKYGDRVG